MMLTFYGLYKQATLGTCKIGTPGFWHVIGKAKWYVSLWSLSLIKELHHCQFQGCKSQAWVKEEVDANQLCCDTVSLNSNSTLMHMSHSEQTFRDVSRHFH